MENSIKTEDKQAPKAVPEKVENDKKPRTLGLKLFDIALYPLFTNVGVVIVSVAATYLTSHGADRNASGKRIFGWVGETIQKRGDWLVSKFKNWGMSHNQADMAKMVTFSFVDGSLLAPVVKMFEDRREKIARYLDDKLGTQPDNMSVYEAEPRQSWLSVLGGRFLTASVVVPTAVALDKTGLNDKLFSEPGQKFGAWLGKKSGSEKWFGVIDVKDVSRIGFFEVFYTSVCTGGLYIISRAIARCTGAKTELPTQAEALPVAQSAPPETHDNTNHAHVSHRKQLLDRVAPAHSHRERYMAEHGNVQAMGI